MSLSARIRGYTHVEARSLHSRSDPFVAEEAINLYFASTPKGHRSVNREARRHSVNGAEASHFRALLVGSYVWY